MTTEINGLFRCGNQTVFVATKDAAGTMHGLDADGRTFSLVRAAWLALNPELVMSLHCRAIGQRAYEATTALRSGDESYGDATYAAAQRALWIESIALLSRIAS